MKADPQIEIARLSADDARRHLRALGTLLHACVHAGASVGFILPFSEDDAMAYWAKKVIPAVKSGSVALLIAWHDGGLAGTVQLDHDTMPNQPHRAELRKLLVHPDVRRRGIAKKLITEAETIARSIGRSLITLDTRTGDAAEPLYVSLGYQRAGIIPGYCLDPFVGRLDSTTVMFKAL